MSQNSLLNVTKQQK